MKSKFIVFIVVLVLIVAGLGVFMNKTAKPSKYDDFAKALKDRGAEFYGAFWCPHCIAQKTLFGTAKKYLPYIECSTPNKAVVPLCLDKKIESYPTWMFKDGVTLKSKSVPTVCEVRPGKDGEPSICSQVNSENYRVWLFPEYKFSVKSPADPTSIDGVWKFPVGAQTAGEIPLEFLAEQIEFTLPE